MGCGVSYIKIKRLPLYPVPYRKEPLTEDEIKLLFSDEVVVEEKIDGKQSCVDCGDYVIFYEYMEIRHQILYTKLPSHRIAFDVYDVASKRLLGVPEKHEVLKSLGWCYTPVIYIGKISASSWREEIQKLMKRPSIYGAPLIEGIVAKNYRKQIFGKAINREFDEAIKGKPHYTREMRKRGEPEKNRLYQGEEWSELCYPRGPAR